jgi:hypothetical protein
MYELAGGMAAAFVRPCYYCNAMSSFVFGLTGPAGPGGARDRSHGWSVAGAKPRDAEPVKSSEFLSSRSGTGGGKLRPDASAGFPVKNLPPASGAEMS